MTAHELIERYIHEVGTYLPRRQRADIQRELTSLLNDELDERSGGEAPTVQMTSDLLLEFGRPRDIAAQYHNKQHLIGPALYPQFRLVTGIVLSVLSGIYLLIFVFLLWNGGDGNLGSAAWNWLQEYLQSCVTAFGFIALIFVGIEHFAGDQVAEQQDSAEWNPLKLPAVDDPNRIKRGETIFEVVAGAFFLGLVIAVSSPGGLLSGLIAESFRPTFGWMIASSAVGVALKSMLLFQGRWTIMTRILEIAADLFSLYVLSMVVTGGDIVTIAGLSELIKLGMGVALIVIVIAIVFKIIRLIWNWQKGTLTPVMSIQAT